MNPYGVILHQLRLLKKLTIKQAATLIGRSAGWLSEVENGKGFARIDKPEFDRIVAAYEGDAYRRHFGLWVAKAHKPSPRSKDVSFGGPVLRYLRRKAKLSLERAAQQAGISPCYLSYLETGVKPLSSEQRDQLMRVYGYSPSSFKNFTSEDKRAKNVPTKDKLNLLLRHLGEDDIEKVFRFVLVVVNPNSTERSVS